MALKVNASRRLQNTSSQVTLRLNVWLADMHLANDTTYHWMPRTTDGQDFFHHLNKKDETLFVALVVMGIAVPCIFISVFALLCIRRHKEKKARRAQMLLRNAQDMAVDDYPGIIHDHRY